MELSLYSFLLEKGYIEEEAEMYVLMTDGFWDAIPNDVKADILEYNKKYLNLFG